MSVKRYDFDGNADGYFDDPFMKVREEGKFVLHSDYAALEARHNALAEAVAKFLLADDALWEFRENDGNPEIYAMRVSRYQDTRAEVDRLIADCEGEG